jgi:hypothetical protein
MHVKNFTTIIGSLLIFSFNNQAQYIPTIHFFLLLPESDLYKEKEDLQDSHTFNLSLDMLKSSSSSESSSEILRITSVCLCFKI